MLGWFTFDMTWEESPRNEGWRKRFGKPFSVQARVQKKAAQGYIGRTCVKGGFANDPKKTAEEELSQKEQRTFSTQKHCTGGQKGKESLTNITTPAGAMAQIGTKKRFRNCCKTKETERKETQEKEGGGL